ncbi:hypothetical protein SDC9_134028 [bioreactor metagenome]|uniref:Uncharacterized protein n=1 Tax=bioreactor metagenome TaxID=1076179 RepID=A0A645DCL7_9ZZZZ
MNDGAFIVIQYIQITIHLGYILRTSVRRAGLACQYYAANIDVGRPVQAHDEQLLKGAENSYDDQHHRKHTISGQQDQADRYHHQNAGEFVSIGMQ